jgi:homeobox protein cut-like
MLYVILSEILRHIFRKFQNMVNQYDKNIDETLNQKLTSEVEKLQADFDDKLKLVEDEKADLEKKCKDAEVIAKTTQQLLEQTQTEIFEATNKLSQKSDAKSDEVEMILNDLEAAIQRAVIAERETEAIKEKLKTSIEKSTGQSSDSYTETAEVSEAVKDLQRELSSKEREVSHLTSEMTRISTSSTSSHEENQAKINILEAANNELTAKINDLKENVTSMADYENVKKDLSILRSLEFGDETSPERSLEVMILERSKALQTENTSLRMEKERLISELTLANQNLSEKINETDEQYQLITELEDHVEKLQKLSNVNRGEAEGRSSTDILYDLDIGGGQQKNSSLLIGGRDSPLSMSSSFVEKNSGDSSSLLPIIQV